MEINGIVRRLDELGRIVIPKEFRKTMRLSEGDEMEICALGDKIEIKKYASFRSNEKTIGAMLKMLNSATGADCLFLTGDSVGLADGKNKHNFKHKGISDKLSTAVKARQQTIFSANDVHNIFLDTDYDCSFVVVEPIVARGDTVGAFALVLDTMPSDLARAYLTFAKNIAVVLYEND